MIGKSYEQATRHYYGADEDPFKLVPVVNDREVAHGIALQVDKSLSRITEEEVTTSALMLQPRTKFSRGITDTDVSKEQLLQEKLNRVVVNAELTHARESPQDFHEDAMQSGAYQMGSGVVMAPLPSPDDLRQ